MATGIESRIAEGLFAKLAALTLSPAMAVAWPDKEFTPPAAGYLRPSLVPNTVRQVTYGTAGKNRHRGLFQISVFWPRNAGAIVPREKADLVAVHFRRGTNISITGGTIRIYEPPVVPATFEDGAYSHTPVTMRYEVDFDNPS